MITNNAIKAKFNFFWHQQDDFTLTNRGYIWTYPGKCITPMSIMVMPEWKINNLNLYDFKHHKIKIFQNLNESLNSVDMAVIFNPQPEFENIDSKVVFDGRGISNNSTFSIGTINENLDE